MQMKADEEGVEGGSMLNSIMSADFVTLGHSSHLLSPDIHNNIDVGTIGKWQAAHKKAIDQEKSGADAYHFNDHNGHNLSLVDDRPIGILAPAIENIDNVTNDLDSTSRSLSINLANANAHTITDQIYIDLPLNNLQRLVVEEVLDHAIAGKEQLCTCKEDQLFLYVKGEGGVGKSQVIKALQLGYSMLDRSQELAIIAPTGAAANNIGGSTIHTALSINKDGKSSTKMRGPWTQQTALIIDEISMLDLKMFATIDQQLLQAKSLLQDSTAIFGGLSVVLLMGDFYQFAPVVSQALWEELKTKLEEHEKFLWQSLTHVITLTQQMRQQQDKDFQSLLQRAQKGQLGQNDVHVLNAKEATGLSTGRTLDNAVFAQTNNTRHVVNRIQIPRYNDRQRQDKILFPAEHSRTKQKNKKPVQHAELFKINNGEGVNASGLLSYSKGMPVAVLTNQCTPLGIVNGARAVLYGVVVPPHGEYHRSHNMRLVNVIITDSVLQQHFSA